MFTSIKIFAYWYSYILPDDIFSLILLLDPVAYTFFLLLESHLTGSHRAQSDPSPSLIIAVDEHIPLDWERDVVSQIASAATTSNYRHRGSSARHTAQTLFTIPVYSGGMPISIYSCWRVTSLAACSLLKISISSCNLLGYEWLRSKYFDVGQMSFMWTRLTEGFESWYFGGTLLLQYFFKLGLGKYKDSQIFRHMVLAVLVFSSMEHYDSYYKTTGIHCKDFCGSLHPWESPFNYNAL